jgi:16S rRNA (guanine527-N7)-methyltransferase
MGAVDFERAIRARLRHADHESDDDRVAALARYLALLARWNRRINLAAFDLDRPSDHAIDRLIVEPVLAAAEVSARDRVVVDIGSGGGSPALPLKIQRPHVRMTLVEARVRKTAFLREAVRELGLAAVRIETARMGRAGITGLNGTADVVTMRAVRMDGEVLAGITALLAPGGRLLWFGSRQASGGGVAGWSEAAVPEGCGAFLRVQTPDKVI